MPGAGSPIASEDGVFKYSADAGATGGPQKTGDPEDVGQPWQDDNRSFQEQFGTTRPANWENWSQTQRRNWKRNHYQTPPQAPPTPPGPNDPGGTPPGPTDPGGTPPDQGGAGGPGTGGGFNPQDPTTYYDQAGNRTWTADTVRGLDDKDFLSNRPENFAQWSQAQRDQWLVNNYNPYGNVQSFMQNAPLSAVADYFRREWAGRVNGVNRKNLPTTPLDTPVDIQWNADLSQISGSVSDPVMRRMLDSMHELSTNLQQMANHSAGTSTPEYARALRKYDALRDYMARLNVNYDPYGHFQQGDPQGAEQPGVDDDRSTGGGQSDTDIPTRLPDFGPMLAEIRRALGGAGGPQSAAMLEFIASRQQAENAMQQRQQGVNILQPSLDAASRENNPFRALSEDAMVQALQNPDPTNWDTVMNQYAADSAKGNRQAMEALSSSASRRGLPLGAVSGISSRMQSDQGNQLARAMAELENQKALQGRNSLYDAINMSGNVNRQYQGGEDTIRQLLANAVMGTPNPAQNPYSGMADTQLALQQLGLSRDQMGRQEDQAERSMRAQILAQLGGAAVFAAV